MYEYFKEQKKVFVCKQNIYLYEDKGVLYQ